MNNSIILTFSFIFFLPFFGFSQENTFNGGISLGFTTTQIAGDGIGGFNKLGLYGGGYVFTEFKPDNFLQLEMNYIQKGSRRKGTKWDPNTWSIRLNYIEMPLIYKRKFKKVYYQLGLSYGRLINQKFLYLYQKNDDLFNKYEVGFNLGMSYHLSEKLLFETRYERSLLPVRDKTVFITGLGIMGGSYNTVLQFSFKLNFGS